MESVKVSLPVLKHFYVPIEATALPGGDGNDDQISIELFNPGLALGKPPQLAESVHVKNEDSVVF